MTLLGLMSAKGAPGVTATVVGLARTTGRETLVIEADPAGGVLVARCGLRLDPGLASLSAAGRHEFPTERLVEHLQRITDTVSVLIGPSDPRQMVSALGILASRLVDAIRPLDIDLVVDLGRMDGTSPALFLARDLDVIAWLAAPSLEGVDAVQVRRGALDGLRERSMLVTVGDGPYDPRECATVLGLPLAGHLPRDDWGAIATLDGGNSKRLARRPLARAISQLAAVLLPDAETDAGPAAEPAREDRSGKSPWPSRLSLNGRVGSR